MVCCTVWKSPYSNKIAFLSSLPPLIHSLSDLTNLLSALDSARLCIRNSEQSFIIVEVVKKHLKFYKCTAIGVVLGYHDFQFIKILHTWKSILYQV